MRSRVLERIRQQYPRYRKDTFKLERIHSPALLFSSGMPKRRLCVSGRQAARRPPWLDVVEPPQVQVHADVDEWMGSVGPETPGD